MLLAIKVGESRSFVRTNSTTGESFTKVEFPITFHPAVKEDSGLDISWDTQVTYWTSSKELVEVISQHCWSAKSNEIAVIDGGGYTRGELKRVEFKTRDGEQRQQIQTTIWFEDNNSPVWAKVERPVSNNLGNLFEVFARPVTSDAPISGSIEIGLEKPF